MKTISLLLFVVITYSIGFSQDLSIATFNCEFLIKKKVHVKYGFKFDLKDEPQSVQNQWANDTYRTNKFEEACALVAQQIKKIDAEIIGLTEIGGKEDLTVLLEKLKELDYEYPYAEVCKSTDTGTGQHVALLSKHPITVVKRQFEGRALYFTEPDLDESRETGISKGMHATVTKGGKVFDIFLLHLKSERGGYEDDAQRKAQAEIARREVYPLLQDSSKYVVVLGDFNSEKRHETLLTLRGFNDIHEELIQTGDDDFFEENSLRTTYDFRGNKEQIDHILISNSLRKLCKGNNFDKDKWGVRTSVIESADESISDHNGLKVEFVYR